MESGLTGRELNLEELVMTDSCGWRSFAVRARLVLTVTLCLTSWLDVLAAAAKWKTGNSGDWSDSKNWMDGKLPTDGDDVVIAGNDSRVDLKQSARVGQLSIEGTLVIHGWDTVVRARELTINGGGVVTLPAAFQEQAEANRIQIECRERLYVATGGRIDTDKCGFAGGVGERRNDDPTSAGFGPGAGGYPKVWGASAGGSHGGRGGTANAVAVYDSLREPSLSGSGGGGGNGTGGDGGGAIRITAREVVVDGIVSADGGNMTTKNYGGGGSGGSVWIVCESFSGGGRITADGGCGSIYAGGGGGGRVAIHSMNVAHDENAARPTVSATGGANGCGLFGTEEPKSFGEPGTLYFSPSELPARVLPNTGVAVDDEASDERVVTDRQQTVAYWMPWRANKPIVTVQKELYRKHPKPRAAARAWRDYVGPNRELMEVQSLEILDDVGEDITARWSLDNGRTWSEPMPLQASNNVKYEGVTVWEGGRGTVFDPASKQLVQVWLRQIKHAGLYHNFSYWRTSSDLGRSWSEPKLLRYEDGDEFDPRKPLKASFLSHSEGYPGNNILVHSSGVLIHCLAHANAAGDPKNNQRVWRMGSRLMIGRWQPDKSTYKWSTGAATEVTPAQSARGLMEPEVAELKDGRLLVVWRGSDQGWDGTQSTEPGRKWFSISTDNGRSLDRVRPWHYDDGTPFYSPSSIHRLIRHSKTGRLYWFGNLCGAPPRGNSPRYPLVIAEVDETTATLKKDTVTVIDDRDPNKHSFGYQLSNFSLFENRETHEFELFLTTYGQEQNGAAWSTADCYHYRVRQ